MAQEHPEKLDLLLEAFSLLFFEFIFVDCFDCAKSVGQLLNSQEHFAEGAFSQELYYLVVLEGGLGDLSLPPKGFLDLLGQVFGELLVLSFLEFLENSSEFGLQS